MAGVSDFDIIAITDGWSEQLLIILISISDGWSVLLLVDSIALFEGWSVSLLIDRIVNTDGWSVSLYMKRIAEIRQMADNAESCLAPLHSPAPCSPRRGPTSTSWR